MVHRGGHEGRHWRPSRKPRETNRGADVNPDSSDMPWWAWLFLVALALGLVVRVIWLWRHGGFRQADASAQTTAEPGAPTCPEAWTRAVEARSPEFVRPIDLPRPESVEEVATWASSEDFRRTELVFAPAFWVLLPLTAIGFLIWGSFTDPGHGWTGNIFDDHDTGQPWNFWLVWVGVAIWLVIAIGVLVLRLNTLPAVRAENQWIYEHGVAHSLHRASVDYDDGEASGWPTYIALDHRLDDQQAAQIHEAFEQWLSLAGLPPSSSEPISSTRLFGAQAKGGYFFLHLPVSQTAGVATEHRWMLITEPRDGEIDGDGGVIVTPVPVSKQLRTIRAKLRRRADKRAGS